MTATGGPAAGLQSVDLGVAEDDQTPTGRSLQLVGMALDHSIFSWHDPLPESRGSLNSRQCLAPAEYSDIHLTGDVSDATVIMGQMVVYSLTASNAGPDTAEHASIELELADGITFTGGSAGCIETGGFIRCEQAAPVATGGIIQVSVTGVANQVHVQSASVEAFAKQNDTNSVNNELTLAVCVALASVPDVWINEIHYDDTNFFDVGEGVEIAGPAGTDLAGLSLLFYGGFFRTVYETVDLSGVIDNETNAYGALWFPVPGIWNALLTADGVALVPACTGLIQFLSYEGVFIALDGQVAGVQSVDIGVAESGSTALSNSLQLIGTGVVYSNFNWSGPSPDSPGNLNAGQFIPDDPDGDGLPSDWELEFFGGPTNANPNADTDRDGATESEEYGGDTIPTNRHSFFYIIVDAMDASNVVTFMTSSARVYGVESATTSPTGSYSAVSSNIPGTGGGIAVPDTNVAPGRAFYRGRVDLP